jgi:serine/threonine-protein kinase RsbW
VPVPISAAQAMKPHPAVKSTIAREVVIPSDPAEARRLQEEIEQHLQAHHAGERDVFSIKLALEEALINAIKHGNQLDRAKKVTISYRIQPERFDPADVPDPTAVENLERPCGRGLMLMRHYMSEVEYSNGGNSVFMAKTFRANGKK